MRIGLVRHFRVNIEKPDFWMTAGKFDDWVRRYDEAPVFLPEGKEPMQGWDACFASDLGRTTETARHLSPCAPVKTALLREVPLAPWLRTEASLPLPLWNAAGRFAWLVSHPSQPETRMETKRRADEWIELAEGSGEKNILAVSHGFFLMVLAKRLRNRGYTGRKFVRFKNGELHIFQL